MLVLDKKERDIQEKRGIVGRCDRATNYTKNNDALYCNYKRCKYWQKFCYASFSFSQR